MMRVEKESSEGENIQELDLSNVAKGMYFIRVEKNGEEKLVKKDVVEWWYSRCICLKGILIFKK